MPIKKASIKDLRKSQKRRARNLIVINEIKKTVKLARKAIGEGNKEKAGEALKQAARILDKAAQNKVIKKNTAARKKSRLMKAYNKIK